jgi:fumarate reductase subunit C
MLSLQDWQVSPKLINIKIKNASVSSSDIALTLQVATHLVVFILLGKAKLHL